MSPHLDNPSARGPYMLRSSFGLVLIGYMCWRGKMKKGAMLEWSLSIFQPSNCGANQRSNLPEGRHPIIPIFQHSIIPVVSAAN